MTLQNGLIHRDKAYLWTDTAYYDAYTGEFLCFDTKAFQGLYWPYAGIISVIGGNPFEIASSIGMAWCSNIDSLTDATATALRAHAAKGYIGRVLLAAWQDGPALCLVSTDGGGDVRAFEPAWAEHYLNAGNNLPAYHRAVRRGLTPQRMASVIDEQLANPVSLAGPAGEAGQVSQYGGNVVEIEVSREGVESRVLRRLEERA